MMLQRFLEEYEKITALPIKGQKINAIDRHFCG